MKIPMKKFWKLSVKLFKYAFLKDSLLSFIVSIVIMILLIIWKEI